MPYFHGPALTLGGQCEQYISTRGYNAYAHGSACRLPYVGAWKGSGDAMKIVKGTDADEADNSSNSRVTAHHGVQRS